MGNEEGRPKKYKDKDWGMTSFYIPPSFKKTWKGIKKLSLKDRNESLKKYASEIENVDINKRGQGKVGIYVRWILTNHLLRNIHLLKINGVE